jgi:phosphoribosylformylglycinamidine cyclo-ligase
MKLTYEDAGVSIDRGDALIDRIQTFARATYSDQTIAGVGGFASLCALPAGYKKPVLVSGTDGVGTKLKVAFLTGEHRTVGIDLVAMCVNDILTCGAKPLFFLDYFATGKLDNDVAAQVIEGIANGCKEAGCSLLGGETAEMPGFYPDNEYDLAGFVVGVVDADAVLDGKHTEPGDVVLGIASSGLHSNGYSLARRVIFGAEPPLQSSASSASSAPSKAELDATLHRVVGERTLREWLLRPTRIYRRAVDHALPIPGLRSLAHITGGGLPGNLPRVVPSHLGVELKANSWPVPDIFSFLQQQGDIETAEMLRVFNMGIGMTAIVSPSQAGDLTQALQHAGEHVSVIGQVVTIDERPAHETGRVWFAA